MSRRCREVISMSVLRIVVVVSISKIISENVAFPSPCLGTGERPDFGAVAVGIARRSVSLSFGISMADFNGYGGRFLIFKGENQGKRKRRRKKIKKERKIRRQEIRGRKKKKKGESEVADKRRYVARLLFFQNKSFF